MKSILIIVFAGLVFFPAFAQKGELARSAEEYTKLFHNRKVKMARSHAEFYVQAKKNQIVWKYFKDDKFASKFLTEMKFCKDGLISMDLGVGDKAFETAVGKILGFESTFWTKKWKKGYSCEDDGCTPSSIHSKCNSRNCGQAVLRGDPFSPREVLGPRG